jgi:ABC-type sulfate transport system substrate-binding protein
VKYLLSTAGQTEWAKLGYRPVLPSSPPDPEQVPPPCPAVHDRVARRLGPGRHQFFSTTKGSLGIVTQIEANLNQTT